MPIFCNHIPKVDAEMSSFIPISDGIEPSTFSSMFEETQFRREKMVEEVFMPGFYTDI